MQDFTVVFMAPTYMNTDQTRVIMAYACNIHNSSEHFLDIFLLI
jgi:hypothetical protein